MPKGLNIDHYGEYLYTLHLIRKARRRNDPAMAERWSRIALSLFNARRWSEEMDKAEAEASILHQKALAAAAEKKRLAEADRRRRATPMPCGPPALPKP